MHLTTIDYAIIGAYFAMSISVGVFFARRAKRSMLDYFVGHRAIPWWLAGTTMVATTFSADTPLAVTEMVVKNGVAGNWLWWSMLGSGMLTVFFFARLWRRAEVVTDVELTELRYSGRPAAFLRRKERLPNRTQSRLTKRRLRARGRLPPSAEMLVRAYDAETPLGAAERDAFADVLAVCQFEYGISFLDYYWGIEGDREKADWAWHTFVLGHARWWRTPAGREAAARIRAWW